VGAVAAQENFDLTTTLCYFPQRPSLQPTGLSSRQRVERAVLVRDSVFFLLSWYPSSAPKTSFPLMQWLERPIFSQLSTPLPILPAAVCASTLPASLGLLAGVSRVAGSFSLTSSAS